MTRGAGSVATGAAICCGVLLAGYPLLLSGSGLIIALAVLGSGLVAVGLFGGFLAVSIAGIAILVAEYLTSLFISGSSFDFLSAAFAVALLLLIELVDLAEAWRQETPQRTVLLGRLRYLITVVAAGAVVAWLAAIAGTIVNSSLLLLVLGALGGICAVALPLYFARAALASDESDV
ncbi:MAG: hypothetical protein QOH48_1532 [Actinomycetota bacterium]|jgi:hypothetical protein|nr:hypothetical protein [Actinomycetota bacterium]